MSPKAHASEIYSDSDFIFSLVGLLYLNLSLYRGSLRKAGAIIFSQILLIEFFLWLYRKV
jgi:hypothetical protein